jgi:hypothetical protein
LSDACGLRGHHLPTSLFLHVNVDASELTAYILALPLALKHRSACHYCGVAINTHLNVGDAEKFELSIARLYLGKTLSLCLYYTQRIRKDVVISPDAVECGDVAV